MFFSCKASKINTSNDVSNDENENRPVIVFLNCSLVYDTIKKEYSLSLINKIIVEGELKRTTNSEVYGKRDFGYSVLDKNSNVILQKYMPFPLDQTVEYVDDWGGLQKKDIRLDQTQFSLRLPLTSEAKYISFDWQENQLLLIDLKK